MSGLANIIMHYPGAAIPLAYGPELVSVLESRTRYRLVMSQEWFVYPFHSTEILGISVGPYPTPPIISL